jgi:MFS family permease
MNDVELDSWRAEWHRAGTPASDLKDRVKRETRTMRRWLVAETVVTLVFGVGSLMWALLSRRMDVVVLACGIWLFIAMAWAISVLLHRDTWSPQSLTAMAFLDLSILRCRRRRDAVGAQAFLCVVIILFDLAWSYWFEPQQHSRGIVSFLTNGNIVWIWLGAAALGIVALKWRGRLTRELATLVRLRINIDDTAQSKGVEPWASALKSTKGFGRTKRRGGLSARS